MWFKPVYRAEKNIYQKIKKYIKLNNQIHLFFSQLTKHTFKYNIACIFSHNALNMTICALVHLFTASSTILCDALIFFKKSTVSACVSAQV